jgi:hypothetical protein
VKVISYQFFFGDIVVARVVSQSGGQLLPIFNRKSVAGEETRFAFARRMFRFNN